MLHETLLTLYFIISIIHALKIHDEKNFYLIEVRNQFYMNAKHWKICVALKVS